MSYSWFQTCQTGGQWYSDTYPFSIPCIDFSLSCLLAIYLHLSKNAGWHPSWLPWRGHSGQFIVKEAKWRKLYFFTICLNWEDPNAKLCPNNKEKFFPTHCGTFKKHKIDYATLNCEFFIYALSQWKRTSCKQNARWQHLSRLKANAFFSLKKKISCYETLHLILGIGYTI